MIKKLLFGILILFQCQVNAQVILEPENPSEPFRIINVIGTSVSGWDNDVPMQTTDGVNYSLTEFQLKSGEFKFREGNSWTNNWGGTSLEGEAEYKGSNFLIEQDSKYNLSFNLQTLAYNISKSTSCICPAIYAPVCVNGKTYGNECEAACNGETTWVNGVCEPKEVSVYIKGSAVGETQKLYRGGIGFVLYDEYVFAGIFTLNTGDLQFEVKEVDQTYILSGTGFPDGKASDIDVQIPVKEGRYAVWINIATKEYHFYATPYVNIAGVNLSQVDSKGNYQINNVSLNETNLVVTDNEYGNDALEMLVGDGFPQGTLTNYSENPVKVPAGVYNIYYNTFTREYKFELSVIPFKIINMIGSSLKNWDIDVPMQTTDGVIYRLTSIELKQGELKFRQDSNWVNNWGGTSLNGDAVPLGSNIIIENQALYNVTLNLETLTYKIEPVTIIEVFGGAVGNPLKLAFMDGVYMVKDVELGDGDVYFGGIMEGDVTFQMGGSSFPNGDAIMYEAPVKAEAGTYDIILHFNGAENGSYEFVRKTLSNSEFEKQFISFSPNPTQGAITFTEKVDEVKVFDLSGRLVKLKSINSTEVDLSDLQNGVYMLQVSQNNKLFTAKLVKE